MDGSHFFKAASIALQDVIDHGKHQKVAPVLPEVKPGFLQAILPDHAPEGGEEWDDIVQDLHQKIVPGMTNWQSPNFLAFFPANISYPSIIGEIYSAAFNNPGFNWLCSPSCTELEVLTMDWIAKALDLPESFLSTSGKGGGVIHGSASEGILCAMVAARDRMTRAILREEGFNDNSEDGSEQQVEDKIAAIRGSLVALGSEQVHASTRKVARLIGVRYRAVKATAGTGYAITKESLEQAIDDCKAAGLHPFYFTATLGTTSCCAIDPFAAVYDVKKQNPSLWVHVDAAYGGTALICEEIRRNVSSHLIAEFDSFGVNLHKWLLVNIDASCFFVKDQQDLNAALSAEDSYLENPNFVGGNLREYRDWQISYGRRFRSLKIWMVLRTYGLATMRAMVRSHLLRAEYFASLCQRSRAIKRGMEVVFGPSLALITIRFTLTNKPLANKQDLQCRQLSETKADSKETTNGVLEKTPIDRVHEIGNGILAIEGDNLAASPSMEHQSDEILHAETTQAPLETMGNISAGHTENAVDVSLEILRDDAIPDYAAGEMKTRVECTADTCENVTAEEIKDKSNGIAVLKTGHLQDCKSDYKDDDEQASATNETDGEISTFSRKESSTLQKQNDFTKAVLEHIMARRHFHLTQVQMGDKYCIRIMAANESSSNSTMDDAFNTLCTAVEELWESS